MIDDDEINDDEQFSLLQIGEVLAEELLETARSVIDEYGPPLHTAVVPMKLGSGIGLLVVLTGDEADAAMFEVLHRGSDTIH